MACRPAHRRESYGAPIVSVGDGNDLAGAQFPQNGFILQRAAIGAALDDHQGGRPVLGGANLAVMTGAYRNGRMFRDGKAPRQLQGIAQAQNFGRDALLRHEPLHTWRDHRGENREHDKDDQQLDQRKTCLSRPLCDVTAS